MMSMNIERIEALAQKYCAKYFMDESIGVSDTLRNALTEQAETHAIELRAYEATVANLNERIRQMAAERVPEGYAIVPIEPTIEMLDEIRWQEEITDRAMIARYKSMLAAVPQQKEGA